MKQPTYASAFGAADLAIGRRRQELTAWVAAEIQAKQQEPRSAGASPVASTSAPVSAAAPSSVWDCIAIAERSGHDNPAMGPTYWTEYGVIVDVILDYGTPAEQAAIFGGTADAATRLAPVARFAAKNGFGGWGVLTRQKCGL